MKKEYWFLMVIIICISCNSEESLKHRGDEGSLVGLATDLPNTGGRTKSTTTGLYIISEIGDLEEMVNFFTLPYFTNERSVYEFAIDGHAKKIYCPVIERTNTNGVVEVTSSIIRFNYDGSELEVLFDSEDGVVLPEMLKVSNGKIYWVNSINPGGNQESYQDFYSASSNGSGTPNLIESGLNTNILEVSDDKIYMENTDGITVRDVSNPGAESLLFQNPAPLTVNFEIRGLTVSTNKIYIKVGSWNESAAAMNFRILEGNVDGSGSLEEIYAAPQMFQGGAWWEFEYFGIACDKKHNKLYFTESPDFYNPWDQNGVPMESRLISIDLNTGVSGVLVNEWYGEIHWVDN